MPDENVVAGRALFATNCVACHSGSKWTKSSTQPYQNNPTFADIPLAANVFAEGREPPLDQNLTVAGPQIVLNAQSQIKNPG